MRRLVLSLLTGLLALVLLPVPPVHAKLPAELCGANGCVPVGNLSGPLHSTNVSRPAPEPAPFYLARFYSTDGTRETVAWSYLFVPAEKAMRGNDFGRGRARWMDGGFVALNIRKVVRSRETDLKPFPAPARWSAVEHLLADASPTPPKVNAAAPEETNVARPDKVAAVEDRATTPVGWTVLAGAGGVAALAALGVLARHRARRQQPMTGR